VLGALLLAAIASGLGLGLGALLRRAARAKSGIARWMRYISAALGSAVAAAFAAGVVGVFAGGAPGTTSAPTLVVFSLALIGAALLLWRGPSRHLGVAGHWLGALWWMLSAVRAGSPVLALMFAPVAVVGLLAAGMESIGAGADEGLPARDAGTSSRM